MGKRLIAHECGYTPVGRRFTLAFPQRDDYPRGTPEGGWYIAGENAGHSDRDPYPGHINIYTSAGCNSHHDFAAGRTYLVVGHRLAIEPHTGTHVVLEDVTLPDCVQLPEGI